MCCAVLSLSVVSDSVTPGTVARHGILQIILEWVAMPSSRGSSPPRDRTLVSPIAGRFFYHLRRTTYQRPNEYELDFLRRRIFFLLFWV